jgi:hypothetical protein
MPTIPTILIDKAGSLSAVDNAARALVRAQPGMYRAHRSDGLLVLSLDEGTGAAPREGETLAIAGDVGGMPLLGLLNQLGQNRETGRLIVKREQAERVIILKAGDVASVGSNLPRDRLGTYLVRLGKVTEQQLEQAQRETEGTGKRIGQILLAKGIIDAHELWSSIQQQITEIFADVVSWTEGSFILFRVPADFRFPSTPPLSMQGLLLEAVRRADEMSVFRERIPNGQTRLRRTSKAAPSSLSEDELRAIDAVGREASVADVARALHMNEFDATKLCYAIVKQGLVELITVQSTTDRIFVLRPEDRERIDIFNLAFREIRDEIVRAGQLENFTVGVMKYLSDAHGAFHRLFVGLAPDETGALPVERLVRNLTGVEHPERMTVLTEALNELTFFMLFQCGELLDPRNDENLGRRVRLIHASLGAANAKTRS